MDAAGLNEFHNHSLAMFNAASSRIGSSKIFLCGFIFALVFAVQSQEQKKTTANTNAETDAVRGYLEVQEKLHATLLAIDRYQQEADAAAARAAETSAVRVAETISNRLAEMEKTIFAQRSQQDETVNKSNQLMLILTSAFGVLGLLAFVGAAWLNWRAANRLAEVVTVSSRMAALGSGRSFAALSAGDMDSPVTISTGPNLLGTITRLEKRIQELEQVAHISPPKDNGASHSKSENGEDVPASPEDTRIKVLLGKGNSLVHLNKIQEAIACFDEVLAMDPENADAFVKKGNALERQEKLKEALDCYDRAIQADDSLTIAYLQKGGVFNRLELYSMAQECYEQALRTQEKRPASV